MKRGSGGTIRAYDSVSSYHALRASHLLALKKPFCSVLVPSAGPASPYRSLQDQYKFRVFSSAFGQIASTCSTFPIPAESKAVCFLRVAIATNKNRIKAVFVWRCALGRNRTYIYPLGRGRSNPLNYEGKYFDKTTIS